MKRFTLPAIVVLIIAGCTLLNFLPSGELTFDKFYDLDNGVQIDPNGDNLSDADLILEPWYKDGEPAPALQLYSWGDNATFIHDLGEISLDKALSMSDSEIEPDSIEWDVYVNQSHTYYIVTSEMNEFFLYVSDVEIQEDETTYEATVKFNYQQRN
ncbi:MAG: hypothetical protein R6U31_05455 [bacterium]